MRSKFRRRRKWLVAVLVAAMPAVFLAIPTGTANADPATVYMQDNPGDTGSTPSVGSWWASPDIVVCPTPAPCSPDVPVVPGGTYYLDVTLHNPGRPVSGQLSLWVADSAGASTWPGPWANFITIPDTLPTGVTTLTGIPWTAPPSVSINGHFCLAAIWTSPNDLVTNYSNMEFEVRYNRNVVQHNVAMLQLIIGGHLPVPVNLRDPYPQQDKAGLVFVPAGQAPFIGPGTIVVDLGPELGQRWIAAGAPGTGIQRVGSTQVRIVDPRQASIEGLTLNPGDDFQLSLDFAASSGAGNQYTEELEQTDAQGDVDGGVEYRLAVQGQSG